MKTKLFTTIGFLLLILVFTVGSQVYDLSQDYINLRKLENEFVVVKQLSFLNQKLQSGRKNSVRALSDATQIETLKKDLLDIDQQMNLIKNEISVKKRQILSMEDFEKLKETINSVHEESKDLTNTSGASLVYSFGEAIKLISAKLEFFSALMKSTEINENTLIMYYMAQAIESVEYLDSKMYYLIQENESFSQLDMSTLYENKYQALFYLGQNIFKNPSVEKKFFESRKSVSELSLSDDWTVITEAIEKLAQQIGKGEFDINKEKLFFSTQSLLSKLMSAVQLEQESFDSKFHEITLSMQRKLVITSAFLAILFLSVSVFSFTVINKISRQIVSISSSLNFYADKMKWTSEELLHNGEKLSESAIKQSNVVQETSASITEITALLASTTQFSDQSNKLSQDVKDQADQGLQLMKQLMQSMDHVSKSNQDMEKLTLLIKEIYDKTQLINDIVFKTQILSFNASIEAARAGEHGRGFAVVADEVGQLASMSGKISQDIQTLVASGEGQVAEVISANTKHVHESLDSATEVFNYFKKIDEELELVSQNTQQIHASSLEQEVGVNQINSVMKHVDESSIIAQKNCEELNKTSVNLKSVSDELINLAGLAQEIAFGNSKFSNSSSSEQYDENKKTA